jgi:serine/threonine protein kinase
MATIPNKHDRLLLRMLRTIPTLSPLEVDALARYWQRHRRANESVMEFLVRQRVLEQPNLPEPTPDLAERLRQLLAPTEPTKPEPFQRRLSLEKVWSFGLAPRLPRTRPYPTPRPGLRLNEYLLVYHSGSGSSGLVFRAVHLDLQLTVALKIMHPDLLLANPDLYLHFWAEAKLLTQLRHPNIVRVLDCGEFDGLPYLVMEYVEGITLLELIEQSGRIRWDRALRMICQVAHALTAAERMGVVHRDIKPANLLLARDGVVKLADLGLACVANTTRREVCPAERLLDSCVDSEFYQTDHVGTAAYMAPEQARGEKYLDSRADIYALGVCFYHLVTGHLPFHGPDREQILAAHLKQIPDAPHELVPEIPRPVSAFILQMMAKQPDDRVATPSDLLLPLAELSTLAASA